MKKTALLILPFVVSALLTSCTNSTKHRVIEIDTSYGNVSANYFNNYYMFKSDGKLYSAESSSIEVFNLVSGDYYVVDDMVVVDRNVFSDREIDSIKFYYQDEGCLLAESTRIITSTGWCKQTYSLLYTKEYARSHGISFDN